MRNCLLFVFILLFSVNLHADDTDAARDAVVLYEKGKKALSERRYEDARLYADEALRIYSKKEGRVLVDRDISYRLVKSGRTSKREEHVKDTYRNYQPSQLLQDIDLALNRIRTDSERAQKELDPPQLRMHLEITDADRDGVLSAGENGQLIVRLRNEGNTPAHQVKVTLKNSHKALKFDDPERVFERVPALGETAHLFDIRLARSADLDTLTFEAYAEELDGFGVDAVRAFYPSAAFAAPEIQVEPVSGTTQLTAGQTQTLRYRIRNVGEGTARGLTLRLSSDDPDKVSFAQQLNIDHIPHLQPGTSEVVQFSIQPQLLLQSGDTVSLTLHTQDANLGSAKHPMSLEITRDAMLRDQIGQGAQFSQAKMRLELAPMQIASASSVNRHAYALVIANRGYQDREIPAVKFAADDASLMERVLHKSLGIPKENIIRRDDVTLAQFNHLLGGSNEHTGSAGLMGELLSSHQQKYGVTPRLYFFFSGHGAPASNRNWSPYLVTADATLSALSDTALAVDQLYARLARLPVQDVSVYLDACFSGNSYAGALMRNISPVAMRASSLPRRPTQLDLYAAAQQDQVANWLTPAKQGLFTYVLAHGLSGKADQDGNKSLTNVELQAYLERELPYLVPRIQGFAQRPQVELSDPRTLTQYH